MVMINKDIFEHILYKIDKEEKNSPFLFLGKNIELLNLDIRSLWLLLLEDSKIPKNYLFILEDNLKTVKVKEVKDFIELSNSKPPYKFQIFLIENISRFTNHAWNSLLKFFEETEKSNIIFLTNISESNILDTILSRVQIINCWWIIKEKKDNFIQNLLKKYFCEKNHEILSYYYRNKLQKEDYINFLENFIIYSKENFSFINYLDEINDDINSIKQNNVNGKYIVDKWLIKL